MKKLTIYVDVDDTLVRTVGDKCIPIPHVINQVKSLFEEGAELYCWSSGGHDYAKNIAQELGIDKCFIGFLTKPDVMIDDQEPSDWKYLMHLYPSNAGDASVDELNPYKEINSK